MAAGIQKELVAGTADYPFSSLVHCSVGNPQAVGQQPPSFNREVLALLTAPALLDRAHELVETGLFSAEAVDRAREYAAKGARVGAYTDSVGFGFIREEVAEFIFRRDGIRVDPSHVLLTSGASEGVRLLYGALAARHLGGRVGIMAPIPQYPLYSALATLSDTELVGYYLDEDDGWAVTASALERAYADATARGVVLRALVVVNPGNPCGANLGTESLVEVVRFAADRGLVLIADEVYQENVLTQHPFRSVSSVARGSGVDVELASMHSVSKGHLGECGVRGGYLVLENFDEDVVQQFVKLKSIELCSNTVGQLSVGLMVRPPTADAAPLYERERRMVLEELRAKAAVLTEAMRQLDGITMPAIGGAMYAFPRVRLPRRAVAEAERSGVPPDEYYCVQALRRTGLVVVPGSGFRQAEGTFHFRITFLPARAALQGALSRFAEFHGAFMARHAD